MPRTLTALMILATILISNVPSQAAKPFIRKGPYLSLAPYTHTVHVDMEYTLPDFTTRTSSQEWLPFMRLAVGYAFSEKFALGLDYGTTGESYDESSHEYTTKLLRATWFPTAGRWYLTGGFGFGTSHAPLKQWPGYERGMAWDSSWLVALGAGYELPVWRNLAVQVEADWLQQRAQSHEGNSGHDMDIDSWTLGATLIWYP